MSLGLAHPVQKDQEAALLRLALSWVLATLVPVGAAGAQSPGSTGYAASGTVPTQVQCADAAQLRRHAADDRTQSTVLTSDQERVIAGNRANFLSSLGLIADFKCKAPEVDIDDALRSVLDAGHRADAAGGFYEAAHLWNQATFDATQVASVLAQQLAPSLSR